MSRWHPPFRARTDQYIVEMKRATAIESALAARLLA